MGKVAYDNTGSQVIQSREYDIASNTAITEGQFVKLSAGKVIAVVAGETAAILGIAAEAHSGSADAFNTRSNGTRIKVYDSPSAVYEVPVPKATCTSGTTTTMVATGVATFADDDFAGGYMRLVSKVAASTNTDPVGTIYPITGSTASSKTFTTTKTAGGAHTAGDIFEIYPPVNFAKGNFDSGFQKLVLTATAAMPVKVANIDIDRKVIFLEPALHLNGSKQS